MPRKRIPRCGWPQIKELYVANNPEECDVSILALQGRYSRSDMKVLEAVISFWERQRSNRIKIQQYERQLKQGEGL